MTAEPEYEYSLKNTRNGHQHMCRFDTLEEAAAEAATYRHSPLVIVRRRISDWEEF